MGKQFVWVVLFLITLLGGCSKDEVAESPAEESQSDSYWDLFPDINPDDFKEGSLRVANSSGAGYWFTGIKDEKFWIGLFSDDQTDGYAKLLDEWMADEKLEPSIKQIGVASPLSTNFGYVTYGCFVNYEIESSLDGEKIYVMVLKDNAVEYWETDLLEDFPSPQYFCLGDQYIYLDKEYYLGDRDNDKRLYDIEGKLIADDLSSLITEDTTYISYFNGDKLSILIGDSKIVNIWSTSDSFDRNRRYHVGYGEYEEFYINDVAFDYFNPVTRTDWGFIIAPHYNGQYSPDLFLLNDRKIHCIRNIDHWDFWYDNSILAYQPRTITNTDKEHCLVLSPKGEILAEFEDCNFGDSYMVERICQEPCSYVDIIKVIRADTWVDSTVVSVEKYDLQNQNSVWKVNIDALGSSSIKDKFVASILEKNKDNWTMEVSVTSFDGKTKTVKFSLDINTGEISYL